jgi:hypothetical protein
MDYRNILSASVLVAAAGFLLHGYPNANAEIGPTVSTGTNPLVHATGSASGTLFTAPSDQLIVISDVILTASGSNGYQPCTSSVLISSQNGDFARFLLTADTSSNEGSSHPGTTISHSFAGGIPVEPSEQVSISISGNCSVNYVISGYHAQQ